MSTLNIQHTEYNKLIDGLQNLHKTKLQSIKNTQTTLKNLSTDKTAFHLEYSSSKLNDTLDVLDQIISELEYVLQQSEEDVNQFMQKLVNADKI